MRQASVRKTCAGQAADWQHGFSTSCEPPVELEASEAEAHADPPGAAALTMRSCRNAAVKVEFTSCKIHCCVAAPLHAASVTAAEPAATSRQRPLPGTVSASESPRESPTAHS